MPWERKEEALLSELTGSEGNASRGILSSWQLLPLPGTEGSFQVPIWKPELMGGIAMSPEGADIDFSPSSQQRTVHEASGESV